MSAYPPDVLLQRAKCALVGLVPDVPNLPAYQAPSRPCTLFFLALELTGVVIFAIYPRGSIYDSPWNQLVSKSLDLSALQGIVRISPSQTLISAQNPDRLVSFSISSVPRNLEAA
jgi:hypothetical protein